MILNFVSRGQGRITAEEKGVPFLVAVRFLNRLLGACSVSGSWLLQCTYFSPSRPLLGRQPLRCQAAAGRMASRAPAFAAHTTSPVTGSRGTTSLSGARSAFSARNQQHLAGSGAPGFPSPQLRFFCSGMPSETPPSKRLSPARQRVDFQQIPEGGFPESCTVMTPQ